MDATVQDKRSKTFVPWRPEPRAYGRAEVGVDRWNDELGRYTFDSVPLEEYIKFWDDEWLKFQGKFSKKPFEKPTSYPTREQAVEYLEWQAEEDAKKQREHERTLEAQKKPAARTRFVEPLEVEEDEEDVPPTPRPQKSASQTQKFMDLRASKAAEPQTGQPKRYSFRQTVDPVVFQQYRLAAGATKAREGSITRNALAEVLFLPRESVNAFLDAHPEFEAELGIVIETKKSGTKAQEPRGKSGVSAIKANPEKSSGSGNLNKGSKRGFSEDEKAAAFGQASQELWAEWPDKPNPLRVIDLIRKARSILGEDDIAEGSLNTHFYTLFSGTKRAAWLKPPKKSKASK